MTTPMHTSTPCPHLMSPFRIGPLAVRNRIVGAPHGTSLGEDNLVSDSNVAYYREKALGGAAIIITESMRVHPTGLPYAGAIALYDPRNKERLRRIPEVVHAEGGLVFAQLNHAGRNMKPGYTGRVLWSASPLASPLHGEVAHEMDAGDIAEVTRGYAESAANAIAAGFDGVEIHGAHGYLLQQFLSPWCNQRTDDYGGSFDNRLRFTLEVVQAVRAAVPRNKVVGIRLSAEEWIEEGIHLEEMAEVARRLAAGGGVDYIHVSTSTYHPDSWSNQIPDMHMPMGAFVEHAAALKQAVRGTPVAIFAVGRIHDPHLAESVIAEGKADMVAMARQLIADPQWPNKVAQNRLGEIRACIACNQGCVGRLSQSMSIRCVVNPTAGREKEWGSWTVEPAARPGHVVVVGAGPAGLEAARVAAQRGHRVTLFEQAAQMGGQVNDAILAPGRQDFGKLVDFLAREVLRLGVTIKLSTAATSDMIAALTPDAVVVATGGLQPLSKPAALPTLDVVSAQRQLAAGTLQAPRHAVIVDENGQYHAYGLAEALAAKGSQVDLVCAKPGIAWQMPQISVIPLQKRLRRAGVNIHVGSTIAAIDGVGVRLRAALRDTEVPIDSIDLLVHARLPLPDKTLAIALRARLPNVHVIGDCSAPRGAQEAMAEGHRVGRLV